MNESPVESQGLAIARAEPQADSDTKTYDLSGTVVLPNPPDRSHLPEWPNEAPHPSVRDRSPHTVPRIAGGLSGPHPALASEESAARALLDHQYRNANGETTSRIVLCGVIEEGTRSLQSMDRWLSMSASQLRAAGVGTDELRRARNALAALKPVWHAIGESIASQRRR